MNNVNIWIYHKGQVKLKLKPHQPIVIHSFSRHDEGWSGRTEFFELQDKYIIYNYESDGCDCDGRLKQYGTARCLIGEAKLNGGQGNWEKIDAGQIDEYAEMMGY